MNVVYGPASSDSSVSSRLELDSRASQVVLFQAFPEEIMTLMIIPNQLIFFFFHFLTSCFTFVSCTKPLNLEIALRPVAKYEVVSKNSSEQDLVGCAVNSVSKVKWFDIYISQYLGCKYLF